MKREKQIRIGSLWNFLGEDYMSSGVLQEIENHGPMFTVICDRKNEVDPNAMLVKWGTKNIGYINAEDTRFLSPMMKKNRYHIYFHHIVWPSEKGSSAILKCTALVDLDKVVPLQPVTAWDNLILSAAPIHYSGFTDELELAVNVLYDHMHGEAMKDDMTPDECVSEIERTCKYDMSRETTEMLNELCFQLEMRGTDEATRLLEKIEAASTHRRSRRNQPVLKEWIDDLMDGEDADEQWLIYLNRRKLDLHVAEITSEQMKKDLKFLDEELCALPFDLGQLIDQPERLFYCAFYKGITRERQDELISQLVLRRSLSSALKGISSPNLGGEMNSQEVEETKTISILDSDEAIGYWEQLREKGFVDGHYQRTKKMNRQTSMYVALRFSETLKVRSKWKFFQEYWHIKNLAQERNKMQESGRMPPYSDEIDVIFD